MPETEEKTVKAQPTRDFNDAGTLRAFTKGVVADVTEGEFANYAAANLVIVPEAPEAGQAHDSDAPAA